MKTVDKNKLRQRIKHLNGITDDDRATLLELLEEKTFGLVWEDQKEDVNERMRHELPILIEIPDRAILSGESEAPDHILIEGDNLASLTTLSFTHAGKIDVIYIDPPYNTGNKISEDFIYNDNFVAKETQYRHSKWLSFMSKRLRIAKKLLSERGVIFISIDDNEQAHLKLLCDEIFGRQNFIAQLIWSAGRKHDSRYISISHEYILIYVKNQEFLKSNDITWRERKPGLDDIYNCYRKLAKRYGADYETISLELRQWYKGLPNGHPAKDSSHYCKVGSEASVAHLKHNGFIKYAAEQRLLGNTYQGGVIIENHGNWIYSQSKINNTTDHIGWVPFIPRLEIL